MSQQCLNYSEHRSNTQSGGIVEYWTAQQCQYGKTATPHLFCHTGSELNRTLQPCLVSMEVWYNEGLCIF
ncbi:hypothetical protein NQ317_001439 [Molorchus minor]|uniref:Uncharacterized protein n=1 Tax=Molorchus minor TaxID=1323400 RepID=A0ABQ9JNI3_9CUCU|nr:hypothetical protein NQ317_001439 [Molorchus minor]